MPRVMLELIKPREHFTSMQAIGRAHILLPSAFRKCFRLLLGPAERQTGNRRDAVNKQRAVPFQVVERTTDCAKVRLAITSGRREGRIRPTDPARDIACARPVIKPDSGYRHVKDRKIAGLNINE